MIYIPQVFHQILSFSFLQEKKNSENFNVSENNINSVELAQVVYSIVCTVCTGPIYMRSTLEKTSVGCFFTFDERTSFE
jgi:hypothetical protein